MKKIGLFKVFVLLFILPVFPQSGFVPGFIITHEKDTLHGKVAYVDQALLREACQFIREGEPNPVTWSPDELYGFGFTGDKFLVSKEVTIFTPAHVRRSPNGDIQVPESTIQEKVFLELVVEGAANLYKYDQNVFFAEKNGAFYQLYSEEREVGDRDITRRGQIYTKEFKRYVGVLQLLMNDCPGMGEQINAVNLDEESLTRLFIEYSKCRDVQHRFYKEGRGNTSLSFTLKGGVQGAMFFFTNTLKKSQVFSTETFGFQTTPYVSALVSLSNPRISENSSMNLGLFWTHYNMAGFGTYKEGIYDHNHTVELKFHEVGIPLGVQYSFMRKAIKPYLAGGLVFIMNVNRESNWLWEQVSSVGTTVRDTPDDIIKASQLGGYIGAGLEWPVLGKASLLAGLNIQFTNGPMNGSSTNFVVARSGKLAGQVVVGLKF